MQDLLAAIVESPDDDAPRRVYADALLEADDPLGEFIHLQLDLARDDHGRAGTIARRRREQALWREHKARWIAPLEGLVRTLPEFRRGFLDGGVIAPEVLARRGDELFAAAPLLRRIELDDLNAFMDRPPPLFEGISDAVLARFRSALASPWVSRIEYLWYAISYTYADDTATDEYRVVDLGREAFPAFRDALPRMPHLHALSMMSPGASALIDTGLLTRLDELGLENFGEDEIIPILDALPAERVRKLTLGRIRLDLIGDVLAHPRIAELHRLTLLCQDGMEAAVAAALQQPTFAGLRHLDIMSFERDPTRIAPLVRAIASSAALAGLESLALSTMSVTQTVELARAQRLDALRALQIGARVTRTSALTVVDWPLVKRLETLQLATDARAEELEARFAGAVILD